LDNDPAGEEGTLAAVENVRKVRNVRNVPDLYVVDPVHLGDSKDPDELVRKHGTEALLSILEKREPAALFVGRHLLKGVTPKSPTHEREEAAA
jgi:DNA primase